MTGKPFTKRQQVQESLSVFEQSVKEQVQNAFQMIKYFQSHFTERLNLIEKELKKRDQEDYWNKVSSSLSLRILNDMVVGDFWTKEVERKKTFEGEEVVTEKLLDVERYAEQLLYLTWSEEKGQELFNNRVQILEDKLAELKSKKLVYDREEKIKKIISSQMGGSIKGTKVQYENGTLLKLVSGLFEKTCEEWKGEEWQDAYEKDFEAAYIGWDNEITAKQMDTAKTQLNVLLNGMIPEELHATTNNDILNHFRSNPWFDEKVEVMCIDIIETYRASLKEKASA